MTAKYWIGRGPARGARWVSADRAEVRSDLRDEAFELYSRYVRQWNSIELDLGRGLDEHTHELAGAAFSGFQDGFTLSVRDGYKVRWILEVRFAHGFVVWQSGTSFGRNLPRDRADVRSVCLHWAGGGRLDFDEWIAHQSLNEEA